MSNSGPVVLITGGGKGIGRETALEFLRKGYKVTICGRDSEALEKAKLRFTTEGFETLAVAGDVTIIEDCRRIVDQTIQNFGRLDCLVNNAGMAMRGSFAETTEKVYRDLIAINYLGAVYMTKVALPALLQTGGSVVFISSLAGFFGLPQVSGYSASKMALTALAQSLQGEFRHRLHVGILYVSFTENDQNKTVYRADGSLGSLVRGKNSSTQSQVAKAVYTMVRFHRRRKVIGVLGFFADGAFRYFPGLVGFVLRTFGKNSTVGGSIRNSSSK
ncbi:MAG: SDR family NAD(P)-dependent oxidoreductase [Spirochaetales bacterium]|nr:SDR family NAD(P)-dependent oxidoreductase [Spirochaetales bacterium]